MTMQELLDDTIAYYSVPGRRCVIVFDNAKYSPINANRPKSEGCAIGRHAETEEIRQELDSLDYSSIKAIKENCIEEFNLLPDWLTSMPIDFLQKIQNLHDFGSYWSKEGGLTEEGKQYVDTIKKS